MSKRISRDAKDKVREEVLGEVKQQLALDKFQEERPQLWLQSQRVGRLVEIQGQMEDDIFPEAASSSEAESDDESEAEEKEEKPRMAKSKLDRSIK